MNAFKSGIIDKKEVVVGVFDGWRVGWIEGNKTREEVTA
jgi:hypothetical protein